MDRCDVELRNQLDVSLGIKDPILELEDVRELVQEAWNSAWSSAEGVEWRSRVGNRLDGMVKTEAEKRAAREVKWPGVVFKSIVLEAIHDLLPRVPKRKPGVNEHGVNLGVDSGVSAEQKKMLVDAYVGVYGSEPESAEDMKVFSDFIAAFERAPKFPAEVAAFLSFVQTYGRQPKLTGELNSLADFCQMQIEERGINSLKARNGIVTVHMNGKPYRYPVEGANGFAAQFEEMNLLGLIH